ncbi:LysR family transcriptional regulator [Bosea sp. F3-2]|uniref:LysR family transcriptional regulator n=1 Tax=Bosea sp. F3-2 TaxID=2599640 RepID=UPI0011EF6AD7|nr:LysR family transcriptional regulator [Bosea sp. F3-2]QEL26417.1 LysR family transcriptional regulator [Bosea sp. F3-2]
MGELEAVRVFLAVAEKRGFAAAATALGMTPSAATRAVAALEARLGVQLFIRTTRTVALTAAGALYAERVRPLTEGLERAAQETRETQGLVAGTLRIAAPLSLGLKVLPSMLTQFGLAHPSVRVALSLTDAFVDILDGSVDLAIRISGVPTDKSTIWRKLCPVPRLLVAAPSYLSARGTPGSPEELAEHELLAYGADPAGESWELRHEGAGSTQRAAGRVRADSGDLLAELAVNGDGIALLPRFIVADALAAGRLVPVLEPWRPGDLWLTLYYPPYERLPLRVATFSDFFEIYVTQTRPL